MCYSVESSLKTTLLSLFAIVILLTSKIPYFQWIGVILIGWCGMQFDELLLWLTNPRECTFSNKLITMTLIPLVLMLQPLGSLWGSLYVIPWKKSSGTRKQFMILYSILIVCLVLGEHFYKLEKVCTTITNQGHLNWHTRKQSIFPYVYFVWGILIFLPLYLYWNTSRVLLFLLLFMPTVGFVTGLRTDSKASIWCYYTSYVSVVSVITYALYKYKLCDFF
jgi:hypothetical protein